MHHPLPMMTTTKKKTRTSLLLITEKGGKRRRTKPRACRAKKKKESVCGDPPFYRQRNAAHKFFVVVVAACVARTYPVFLFIFILLPVSLLDQFTHFVSPLLLLYPNHTSTQNHAQTRMTKKKRVSYCPTRK